MCLTFKGVSYTYVTRTSTDFPATYLYLAPLHICVTHVKVSRTYMYLTFKGISYIYTCLIYPPHIFPPHIHVWLPQHHMYVRPNACRISSTYLQCVLCISPQATQQRVFPPQIFRIYVCFIFEGVSHIYTYLYIYVSPPHLLSSGNTAVHISSTDFSYICVFHI